MLALSTADDDGLLGPTLCYPILDKHSLADLQLVLSEVSCLPLELHFAGSWSLLEELSSCSGWADISVGLLLWAFSDFRILNVRLNNFNLLAMLLELSTLCIQTCVT